MSKARKFLTGGVLSLLYPIGCVFISVEDTDICPLEVVGVGKWEKIAKDRVLQGSSDSRPAGQEIAAGLPNITGSIWSNNWAGQASGSSALYPSGWGTNSSQSGAAENTIKFNAARNNSIYGKSSTVQPPALVVSIWKRVE